MKRLFALLAAVPVLAACGASADESSPESASPAALFLARAAAPAGSPGLPDGIRAADGSARFAVQGERLLRFDPATGERTGAFDLPGRWTLGGVSATGRWVGLTRPGTEVLVVDADSGRVAHRLSLRGRFAVETISAEGDFLFLQQDFVDGTYAVRGYDLARGQMLPGSLATKGRTVKMQGLASQTVASPDGRWLLTLYVNTKANTAFVHALNLIDKVPICIVLPPCEDCDTERLARWALALAPDGRTLFAANPAAGRVAEIDLDRRTVVGGASFGPVEGGSTVAEATGSRLLFTDGSTVWSYDAELERVAELEL